MLTSSFHLIQRISCHHLRLYDIRYSIYLLSYLLIYFYCISHFIFFILFSLFNKSTSSFSKISCCHLYLHVHSTSTSVFQSIFHFSIHFLVFNSFLIYLPLLISFQHIILAPPILTMYIHPPHISPFPSCV